MAEFITSLLAFIIAVILLVAVHEFGHFWVARRCGVKVLRFSIGFGQPLWQRTGKDGTEYVIAAIPLGGYVKMAGEGDRDSVEASERHHAFNHKPLAQRTAIVAAGPIFNFLFAIFAWWLVYQIGISGMRPLLGEIDPQTIAGRSGLQYGDRIVAVDGKETPLWNNMSEAILTRALLGESATLTIETPRGIVQQIDLNLDQIAPATPPKELISQIGLKPWQPVVPPILGEIVTGSAAERAGLKSGDHVIAVDGEEISQWQSLVKVIAANPDRPLLFGIERNGERIQLSVTPQRHGQGLDSVGRIGAAVAFDQQQWRNAFTEVSYGPLESFGLAIARTAEMSWLTLRMIGAMISGAASSENLSGPITIARFARDSAFAGVVQFLSFLALVSVSLAVLNLLPIPMLDGGHLAHYLVEWFKGSPLSDSAIAAGQRIGIVLLLALSSLAIYNDLLRLVTE
jgi:regulator of sigma E protease